MGGGDELVIYFDETVEGDGCGRAGERDLRCEKSASFERRRRWRLERALDRKGETNSNGGGESFGVVVGHWHPRRAFEEAAEERSSPASPAPPPKLPL